MKEYANSVLSTFEWFADINGSVIASGKLYNIARSRWDIFKGVRWDDGVAIEGGVEPEVEDVVRNRGM